MAEIINMEIRTNDVINLELRGNTGTNNYNVLTNKPQINGVTLLGNKTDDELMLQRKMNNITDQEIDTIIFG